MFTPAVRARASIHAEPTDLARPGASAELGITRLRDQIQITGRYARSFRPGQSSVTRLLQAVIPEKDGSPAAGDWTYTVKTRNPEFSRFLVPKPTTTQGSSSVTLSLEFVKGDPPLCVPNPDVGTCDREIWLEIMATRKSDGRAVQRAQRFILGVNNI